MKFVPSSLRLRIILVFSLYGLLLGIFMVGSIFIATRIAEEYALKKRLMYEADQYVTSMAEKLSSPMISSVEIPVPTSPYITTYYGEDLLPDWSSGELTGLEPGEYKRNHDKQIYHIAIRELSDGERLYLFYNVTTIDSNREHTAMLRQVLLVTFLPISLFGLMLGLITAHKSVSPVVRLIKIVKKSEETGELPDDFSGKFEDDEVGLLARTLEHAVNEMQTAMEREKAFARDASHELRTPVTTMKGSLELLKKSPATQNEKDQKLFGRLDRSTRNMEHLIQSFLWLSRQERDMAEGECYPHELIDEIIDSHDYMTRNKNIDIIVLKHSDKKMNAAPQIVSILISNLLRNALLYTQEGSVTITINESCISVKDTGVGIDEDSLASLRSGGGHLKAKGFGFGLSIVQRLCQYLGWGMAIDSEVGRGTLVTICHCGDMPGGECLSPCDQRKNLVISKKV